MGEILPVDSREIPGYDGFYRIDRKGCVWSCRVPGPMNPKRGPWKKKRVQIGTYPYVVLSKGRKIRHHNIHRLLLVAFVGLCPKGMEARHFPDQSRTNYSLSNLSWATSKDNQADRVLNGTHNRGERSATAKLTWEKVRRIRRLHSTGRHSQAKLARMYGLKSVQDIIQNLTWKE